jgi:hypothetical protein
MRGLGLAKLTLLFVTALAVAILLMDRPAASVAHGLVVLLVLADPVVMLWANTLNREFLEVWAIYAAISGACLLAATEREVVPWPLLFVGLAVLAFTREHEAILGVVLVVLAWPWMWHRSQRLAAAAAIFAVSLAIVAFALLQHEGVARLPGPDAFGPPLVKAIGDMQHAGPAHGELPAWGFSVIELWTHAMPPWLYTALQAATFLLLPLAVLTLLALRRWRGDPLAPLLLAASLGAVAVHAAAVALFGGAPDPAVRYLPAVLAMYAAIVAAIVGVPVLVRRWMAEWRDMPLELGIGAAALAAGVYAVVLVIPL